MRCYICGRVPMSFSREYENDRYIIVCNDCRKRRQQEKLEKDLESVHEPVHFRGWEKRDMSEAFWVHLGRYKNCPNKRSLEIMYLAILWAHHDDHGLSNSFHHALKWCDIDIFTEQQRKDLPETDKEVPKCSM